MVEETVRRAGRLDVLVNCAAVAPAEAFLDDDRRGLGAGAAGQRPRGGARDGGGRPGDGGAGGGRIVNATSAAARMALPNYAAYAATKAAVDSLTRSAAVALARHGVRVNSLSPGMMDTPLQQRTEAIFCELAGRDDLAAFKAERTARIPLGRRSDPEEMAADGRLARDRGARLHDRRPPQRHRRPRQGLNAGMRMELPRFLGPAGRQRSARRSASTSDGYLYIEGLLPRGGRAAACGRAFSRRSRLPAGCARAPRSDEALRRSGQGLRRSAAGVRRRAAPLLPLPRRPCAEAPSERDRAVRAPARRAGAGASLADPALHLPAAARLHHALAPGLPAHPGHDRDLQPLAAARRLSGRDGRARDRARLAQGRRARLHGQQRGGRHGGGRPAGGAAGSRARWPRATC